MALTLRNEFTVRAPLQRTWDTLLDIGRVAHCLPGAKLESDGADGTFRGGMKVRLGPMNVAYEGVARLVEVDADAHVSAMHVQGKETRGQGTASATIRNHLVEEDGATRVIVETDLAITGRQAQFGRGIMEDVATKMLGEFAKRLEQEVLDGPAPADGVLPTEPGPQAPELVAPAPDAPPWPRTHDASDEVLDLGSAVSGPLARRAGLGALGAVAVSALAWAVGRQLRGRKGLEVTVRYR